jgi:hypothetical protein
MNEATTTLTRAACVWWFPGAQGLPVSRLAWCSRVGWRLEHGVLSPCYGHRPGHDFMGLNAGGSWHQIGKGGNGRRGDHSGEPRRRARSDRSSQ